MADAGLRELRFPAGPGAGEVSALLLRPKRARWLLLLAHGAGADMRHAFMKDLADALAGVEVATLRYQFPYSERGGRRPDTRSRLLATVREAHTAAARHAADLPLLAGGKSMGGRMTSLAAAEAPLAGLRGLVFVGFPLHPAGKPASERGDHLLGLPLPMLFLQGTRDRLAETERMRRLCRQLAERATLHEVEGADHSFALPKRMGRSRAELLEELAAQVASWAAGLDAQPARPR